MNHSDRHYGTASDDHEARHAWVSEFARTMRHGLWESLAGAMRLDIEEFNALPAVVRYEGLSLSLEVLEDSCGFLVYRVGSPGGEPLKRVVFGAESVGFGGDVKIHETLSGHEFFVHPEWDAASGRTGYSITANQGEEPVPYPCDSLELVSRRILMAVMFYGHKDITDAWDKIDGKD